MEFSNINIFNRRLGRKPRTFLAELSALDIAVMSRASPKNDWRLWEQSFLA